MRATLLGTLIPEGDVVLAEETAVVSRGSWGGVARCLTPSALAALRRARAETDIDARRVAVRGAIVIAV